MKLFLTAGAVLSFAAVSLGQVFEPIRTSEEGEGRGRRFSLTFQSSTFDWDLHGAFGEDIFEGKESFLASIDYQLSKNSSIGAWITQDTQEFNIFSGVELDTDWWEFHYTRTFGDSDDNSTVGVQIGLMSAELDLSTVQEDIWATLGVVGSMALDGGDDPKLFMGMHIGYAFNIEGEEFGGEEEPSLFGGNDAFTYGLSLSYDITDTISFVAAYWAMELDGEVQNSLINSMDRISFGLGLKF